MYRRIIAIFLMVAIICSCTAAAAVDKYGGFEIPVDIRINGSFIKCVQKPIMVNNRAYIPLRAFSDAIGGALSWDADINAATFTKNSKSFVFYEERDYSIINGKESSHSAIMYKNLMFIPVRAVSEALDYGVKWDAEYLIVNISAPGVELSQNATDNTYSYDDMVLLSRITHIEGGSQTVKTKVGIAQTVLNRVKSPLFPDTVKGVVFDTKYGVQFPPAHTDLINNTPSKSSIIAAKCALNGADVVGNSLYFISVRGAENSWAHNNRQHYVTIGNTSFYL